MGKILNLTAKVCKKVIRYDQLVSENESLKSKGGAVWGWPNGHYYSPVHNLEDLDSYNEVVNKSMAEFSDSIPGFSDKRMVEEFNKLKRHYKDFDYPEVEDGKSRFYIKNCSYPITDALNLFSMIKEVKPKRIIEIGSGFTSALMIDVNERFFKNKIDITFVEPYPDLLLSRMNKEDKKRYKVIPKKVQEVSVDVFKKLEKGDILFIDSTHVSKFNSDVNYELFNILPHIKPGVIIHFHDVFDGFEYPLQWLKDGWAWNEDYMLRAFLSGNNSYEILIMNDYMTRRHSDLLLKSYPQFVNNCGGGLWIRKTK